MAATLTPTIPADGGFADVTPAPHGASARFKRVVADSLTLAKRSLSHVRHEPERLMDVTAQPIMFILLFAYVFGSAIKVGGGSYREFLMAGIFAQTLMFTAAGTSVALADDMSKGVIDRFRVLPIARSSVLLGRTLADLATSLIGLTVLIVTALLIGWRAHLGLPKAIAGFAIVLLFSYAMGWVGVLVGMLVRNAETAQQGMFLVLFPLTFIANSFVPTGGMPPFLRAFADWNPFSAVVSAQRTLFGNPSGPHSGAWPMEHPIVAALLWCGVILAICVPLAVQRYRRSTAR